MQTDNKKRNSQNKETMMHPSTSTVAGEVEEKEGGNKFCFDNGGFIRARARERDIHRQTDRQTETERDRERTRIRKLSFTRIVVYVQSKT